MRDRTVLVVPEGDVWEPELYGASGVVGSNWAGGIFANLEEKIEGDAAKVADGDLFGMGVEITFGDDEVDDGDWDG